MDLRDVIYAPPARPWTDTSRIPWHDPAFSARMLREHLDEGHDRASRPSAFIERQVAWLSRQLEGPGDVLDLGCGPGLHCVRLAALGHRCTGVDIGPAAIAYAREHAVDGCTYLLEDFTRLALHQRFDLAVLLFGELNAFAPDIARRVLERAAAHLRPGGRLILEVHERDDVERIGRGTPAWHFAERSVFADVPHVYLREPSWHAEDNAAVQRYVVLSERFAPRLYVTTLQGYTDGALERMLYDAGFDSACPAGLPTQAGVVSVMATR